jgi:hypothetical protein
MIYSSCKKFILFQAPAGTEIFFLNRQNMHNQILAALGAVNYFLLIHVSFPSKNLSGVL